MNDLIDRLGLYQISSTHQKAKITLASGIAIENPIKLIKRFYTDDGHILFDLLAVSEDNSLDPASLIAPAFFTGFNVRFDEWGKKNGDILVFCVTHRTKRAGAKRRCQEPFPDVMEEQNRHGLRRSSTAQSSSSLSPLAAE